MKQVREDARSKEWTQMTQEQTNMESKWRKMGYDKWGKPIARKSFYNNRGGGGNKRGRF